MSGLTHKSERAVVTVHDFRYDGQSQSHARFLRREKRIENLFADFRRNTGAGILKRRMLRVTSKGADPDQSALEHDLVKLI